MAFKPPESKSGDLEVSRWRLVTEHWNEQLNNLNRIRQTSILYVYHFLDTLDHSS